MSQQLSCVPGLKLIASDRIYLLLYESFVYWDTHQEETSGSSCDADYREVGDEGVGVDPSNGNTGKSQ